MEERYNRQTLFKPIGVSGQQKISEKHVLILGCGALGTANAEALVRGGIGKLTIIDRDYVELTNLQRQQLFTEQDCLDQIPKAIAAKEKLEVINSNVQIESFVMDATNTTLEPLIKNVDLVIDSTDNFDTRFMLNDLMQKYNIPWIFGSCVGSTGMSYTILPKQSPCLQCILDTIPVTGATCDSVGIIYPTVQMVVAHQQAEALKLLVLNKQALRTKLVTFDLWNNQYHTINMDRAKKDSCSSCGENSIYPHLNYDAATKSEVLCGRNTVQIRNKREVSLDKLADQLKQFSNVKKNDFLLSIDYHSYRVVFFRDGRALIHGTNSVTVAKKVYYQLTG